MTVDFASGVKAAAIEFAGRYGTIEGAEGCLETLSGFGTGLAGGGMLYTAVDGLLLNENGWQNHHTADLFVQGGVLAVSYSSQV